MIPGVTAIGQYPITVLSSDDEEALENPLIPFLQDPTRELVYLMIAYPFDATTEAHYITTDGSVQTTVMMNSIAATVGETDLETRVRFRVRDGLDTSVRAAVVETYWGDVIYVYDGHIWYRNQYHAWDETDFSLIQYQPEVWYDIIVQFTRLSDALWYLYIVAVDDNGNWIELVNRNIARGSKAGVIAYPDVNDINVFTSDYFTDESIPQQPFKGDLDLLLVKFYDPGSENWITVYQADLDEGEGLYSFPEDVGSSSSAILINPEVGVFWNPGGVEGRVPVYLSSAEFATKPDDSVLPNQLFRSRLASPYNTSTNIMSSGRPGGGGYPTFGEAQIINVDGEMDYLVNYVWYGANIRIYVGAQGFDLSEFALIYNGTSDSIKLDYDSIYLPLRSMAELMDVPIQSNVYNGFGPCVRFDGTDDYVGFTLNSGIAGDFTFEVIIDIASYPALMEILCVGDSTADQARRCGINGLGYAYMRCRGDSGSAGTISAASALVPLGRPVHIAYVLDTVNQLQLIYYDGEMVGMATSLINGTTPTVSTLGSSTSLAFPVTGKIDEVRIWSAARTREEINADKDRRLRGDETNLVTLYRMDEGANTSLANAVSGGPVATLYGTPAWSGMYGGFLDLAGKAKPIVVGKVRQIEPLMIDPQKLIYQVHDGPVASIDAVRDQGAELTYESDTTDLYNATVTAGYYKTDVSRGLFRIASPKYGTITADVSADTANTLSGKEEYCAASLVNKLMIERSEIPSTLIETGSFNVAADNAPYILGMYVKEGSTKLSGIVSSLTESVMMFWTWNRDGLLVLGTIDPSVAVTAEITESDFVAGSLNRISPSPPVKRWRVGWGKNWKVMGQAEFAGVVEEPERNDWMQEYKFYVAEDLDSGEKFANAVDEELKTALYYEIDAKTIADAMLDRYLYPKYIYSMKLKVGLHQYNIGQVIKLTIPRFGLDSGVNFVLVGYDENAVGYEFSVNLWG